MTEAKSVRVLIDTVYEPHWQHYQDRFGKTIAGFSRTSRSSETG